VPVEIETKIEELTIANSLISISISICFPSISISIFLSFNPLYLVNPISAWYTLASGSPTTL